MDLFLGRAVNKRRLIILCMDQRLEYLEVIDVWHIEEPYELLICFDLLVLLCRYFMSCARLLIQQAKEKHSSSSVLTYQLMTQSELFC